jgi:hypothetical protein
MVEQWFPKSSPSLPLKKGLGKHLSLFPFHSSLWTAYYLNLSLFPACKLSLSLKLLHIINFSWQRMSPPFS